MEIGHVIRALRKKRGESLEKVAFEAGTDASNLSRIERGIQQPSPELLRAIAATLQTTVATLHAYAEGKSALPHTPLEALGIDDLDFCHAAVQLRRQFRELTPENQEIAVELLRALNRTQRHK